MSKDSSDAQQSKFNVLRWFVAVKTVSKMAGDFTGETWQGRGLAWGGRGQVFPWIPWHPVQTLICVLSSAVLTTRLVYSAGFLYSTHVLTKKCIMLYIPVTWIVVWLKGVCKIEKFCLVVICTIVCFNRSMWKSNFLSCGQIGNLEIMWNFLLNFLNNSIFHISCQLCGVFQSCKMK